MAKVEKRKGESVRIQSLIVVARIIQPLVTRVEKTKGDRVRDLTID